MGRVNQGGVLAEVILKRVPVEKSRDVEGRAPAALRAGAGPLQSQVHRTAQALGQVEPCSVSPSSRASDIQCGRLHMLCLCFVVSPASGGLPIPSLFFGVHQTLHLQTDEG